MLFRLVNAECDSHTERTYVEFRANDGGEIIVTKIAAFRSKSKLSKSESNGRLSARHAMR